MHLREIQEKLPRWEVDTFEHALFHGMKAAGKLAGMVDDMDHALAKAPHDAELARLPDAERVAAERALAFPEGDAGKFVADLVVCALKLAQTCPSGPLDLEALVLARIREKNPTAAL